MTTYQCLLTSHCIQFSRKSWVECIGSLESKGESVHHTKLLMTVSSWTTLEGRQPNAVYMILMHRHTGAGVRYMGTYAPEDWRRAWAAMLHSRTNCHDAQLAVQASWRE